MRELAAEYESPSQDKVVELAVERLYRQVRDEQDARAWAEAADDPEFQAEMRQIAADFDDHDLVARVSQLLRWAVVLVDFVPRSGASRPAASCARRFPRAVPSLRDVHGVHLGASTQATGGGADPGRASRDTHIIRPQNGPMARRMKRTYDLNEGTVARVRELAAEYEIAPSQDKVVELAVERLYRQVRDEQDARAWAEAADDPEFQAEMRQIAADFDDHDTWPA